MGDEIWKIIISAVCQKNINNFKLNGQLQLDTELKINQTSYMYCGL